VKTGRVVLAFTGSFDTCVAIPWLRERHGMEVVTVTLDLGQGRLLEEVRDRALAAGAVRAHVLDAREEFAADFIVRALKADAVYEDRYPMATSLGRALVAQKLVEVAGIEQAHVVAHGGLAKDNDQTRIESAVRALDPVLQVLAPVQEWGMSASETASYGRAHGLNPSVAQTPYSIDANLWGRAVQYGAIDDPWAEAPEEVYTLTKAPAECPDEAAYVEVSFDGGVPVAINGVEMPILDLIGSLSLIAGAHGAGRIDMVENRLAGTKVREIYEAPAAVVLHAAHKELQKMVVTTGVDRFARAVSLQYADTIYNGLWFAPLREALDAFINKVQERVTGVIRMKLFKGDCRVVGRKSPFALYESAPATAVTTASS
jgi:argininosuccinate synthase